MSWMWKFRKNQKKSWESKSSESIVRVQKSSEKWKNRRNFQKLWFKIEWTSQNLSKNVMVNKKNGKWTRKKSLQKDSCIFQMYWFNLSRSITIKWPCGFFLYLFSYLVIISQKIIFQVLKKGRTGITADSFAFQGINKNAFSIENVVCAK